MNVSNLSVNDYNNISLQKINKLKMEGRKICLFIGRLPHEPLPSYENGILIDGDRNSRIKPPGYLSNEEKMIWVSLDFFTLDNLKEIDPNRLHLIVNCNETKELEKIKGLFIKIVVDQSTWKFFEPDIIERLVTLLEVDAKSTLIFESTFGVVYPNPTIDQMSFNHVLLTYPIKDEINYSSAEARFFREYIQEIGGRDKLATSEKFQEFMQSQTDPFLLSQDVSDEESLWIPLFLKHLAEKAGFYKTHINPLDLYMSQARQMTLNHLKTLFNDAVLVTNELYPYPTNWRKAEGYDKFFVATGLKP